MGSHSGKKRRRPIAEAEENILSVDAAFSAGALSSAAEPAATGAAVSAAAPAAASGGAKRRPGVPAALQPAALAAWEAAERRKGIVYLGRIPPYMRAVTLRQRLSAYGELGRMHLSAEDPTAASRRVKAGGCKKTRFEEGWVEFLDKADAKTAAALLHNQAMGAWPAPCACVLKARTTRAANYRAATPLAATTTLF